MKLLLLICAILVFIIVAILGLVATSVGMTVPQFFGVLGIGLALFAASFLPIPNG